MKQALITAIFLTALSVRALGASLPLSIEVDGNEWAQPYLFTDLSWNEINAVCPNGACSSSTLNGWDMDGWTWGNAEALNAMFNVYIGEDALGPGPDRLTQTGSLWAPAILQDFIPTRYITAGPGVFGYLSDSGYGEDVAMIANASDYSTGIPDWIRTDNSATRDLATSSYGAWFYRTSEVPLPAAVWLFGSALAGLCLVNRKKT